ncbi:MAG: N-acetylneuraminate synthase family protein [Candidatus Rokubacteria bacterium]|nr:N-acetylneuraminate synthase family protein [Candidatus Rokubacteria bacterium]
MSPDEKTVVIAEIGENHVGDMDRARRMVIEAASAGVDFVKFQSFLASEVDDSDPEKDWFSRVELSDAMHFELKRLAEAHRVEFLSTPFSVARARFLCEELGLRRIKIASSEMLNIPLLDYIATRVETVFLSTGMATIEEIAEALGHLDSVPLVYVLHCVTAYPTPDDEAGLRSILALERAFPGRRIGYSDHTLGIVAPVAAVTLGARAIEKHFTLDKTLPGTDHILSADPDELRQMIVMIRRVEALLGTTRKAPTAGELAIREFVRRRFPKHA